MADANVPVEVLQERIAGLTQAIQELKQTLDRRQQVDESDNRERDDRIHNLEIWQARIIGMVTLLLAEVTIGIPLASILLKPH